MKAQTMRQVRRWHLYVGVFFTPAILLFAISGALQTFRLQEAKGYGGTPPGWIVWMASVHKNQALPRDHAGERKPAPPAGAAPVRHDDRGPPRVSPLPLKIFVTLLAIGLTASALMGVAIALNARPTRRISILMLIAGTAVPLILLIV